MIFAYVPALARHAHRRLHLALPIVLAGLTGGCATLPKTGLAATGEALSVDAHDEASQHVVQEKVGEVEHHAADGSSLGKSELYASRTVTSHRLVWQANQGDTRLDDEDFFRIAGDVDAAKEIHETRDNGVLMNRVGLGILAVAAASVAGGYALSASGSDAGGKISTVGAILVPVGGILAIMGQMKTNREHPLDDRERAERDARHYNASIGTSGTTRLTSAPIR